jgi:hypothetical protein
MNGAVLRLPLYAFLELTGTSLPCTFHKSFQTAEGYIKYVIFNVGLSSLLLLKLLYLPI